MWVYLHKIQTKICSLVCLFVGKKTKSSLLPQSFKLRIRLSFVADDKLEMELPFHVQMALCHREFDEGALSSSIYPTEQLCVKQPQR